MSAALKPSTASKGIASKGVLALAAPLVISFWFRSAFQWVDTAYASTLEGLGDASIAAIGLTLPFEFLMIACWVGTSNSLTSRLSAAMGAGEGAKIEQLLSATRKIVVALVALFLAVALGIWIWVPRMGLDPDVAQQFRVYGTMLLAGSSLTTFWSILPDSIVKAHHDTKATMWAGVASSVTNVVFNTVFVFVFHWGIFGIALATVLGRLGGLGYAWHKAAQHEARRKQQGGFDAPGLFERPLRVLLGFALPAGLSFVFLAVEGGAFNWLIAARPDAAQLLPAWSILDKASRFLVMPIIAVGVALLPLTARLWGAGQLDQIRKELRTASLATFAFCVLFIVPVALIGGPYLADALVDSLEARESALRGLRWLPIGILFSSPLFLMRPTFEGLQQPRPGLVVAALRALVLVVPLGALGAWLAPDFGGAVIEGLVLGSALGAGIASLVMTLWLRRYLVGLGSARPSEA